MLDVACSLASNPEVLVYFAALGWAVHGCGSRLGWGGMTADAGARRGAAWCLALSVSVVGVTWFLILRWTVAYHQAGGEELFDAAYVDVLKAPHFGASSQLLTWVVVAAVWAHGAHPCYMVFGMLGAMSAAFLTWVPVARSSGRKIPLCFAATSALALYAVTMLSPEAGGGAAGTSEDGFNPEVFSPWLKALHVLLVLPLLLAWLWPKQPTVDGTLLYGALAVLTAGFHLSQVDTSLLASGDLSAAFAPLFAMPVTDCQLSITTDLCACAVITLWVTFNDSGGSLPYTVLLSLLLPVVSPAAILALHMTSMHFGAFHADTVTSLQRSVAMRLRTQSIATTDAAAKASREVKARGTKKRSQRRRRGKTPTRRVSSSKASFSISAAAPSSSSARQPQWTNLGLWTTRDDMGENYDAACERLAIRLAEAACLEEGDAVLSCGCGRGDELHLYKDRFGIRHVTGLDLDPEAAFYFKPKHNVRLLCKSALDMASTFFPAYFNKIVALDNVYHYPSKRKFFADAAQLLGPSDLGAGGGMVAVTDIILSSSSSSHGDDDGGGDGNSSSSGSAPCWLRCLLRAAGIPSCNLWTESQYISNLQALGFENIKLERVGDCVLSRWLPAFVQRHLDYAVVSATLSSASSSSSSSAAAAAIAASAPKPSRIKVAVVGSGLAGLSAAHSLTTSGAPVEVTVFESRSKAGLSGDAEVVSDTVVDIPLRMIGKGYYSYVEDLANKVGVPTVVAPTDCCFYGATNGAEDSPTGMFSFGKSWLLNLIRAVPFVSSGLAFDRVLKESAGSTDFDDERSQSTFGEWMDSHGYSIAGGMDKGRNITMEDSTNPLVWAMMGQLSWVLSCTYEQARGYPAKIVLDFFRGLSLGLSRGMLGTDRKIVRVHPSIDALQLALAYGSELVCDTRIKGIEFASAHGQGSGVVLNGVHFDYVIVATEAMAVKHVLGKKLMGSSETKSKNAAKNTSPYEVFNRVQYQPSSIVLHTDPTSMPPNRADWCALNVEMQPDSEMSQLTVWLNAYYPHVDFPEDTFETWNALRSVENVQKEAFFQRVVHTRETPHILEEIESIQGKDSVYYAGSYCVYGMGLLEQAASSGKQAAEKLLDDAACAWLNESRVGDKFLY
jgi:predicted NAD/FAD-binding protein